MTRSATSCGMVRPRLSTAVIVDRGQAVLRRELSESIASAVRRAVVAEHDVALRDFRLLEPGTVPRTSSGKVARGAGRAAFLGEQDARR